MPMWHLNVLHAVDNCRMYHSSNISVDPMETVHNLKAKACAAFSVDPGSVRLWDYLSYTKFACLDQVMQQTVQEARILDGQSLLLEPHVQATKVISLEVYQAVVAPDGSTSLSHPTSITVHPTESAVGLKQKACAAVHVSPADMDLWDYFNFAKHMQLCGVWAGLTCEELRLMDGQALLLEPRQEDAAAEPVGSPATGSQRSPRASSQFDQSPATSAVLPALPPATACPQELLQQMQQQQQQHRQLQCKHQSCRLHCNRNSCNASVHANTSCSEPDAAAVKLQQLQQCVVCLEASRSVLLLPCRHLAFCERCVQQVLQRAINCSSRAVCPVCRGAVTQIVSGVMLP